MSIDDYFAQIEISIIACPYVLRWNLLKDKRSQTIGYFRGHIEFSNSNQLHVMEFVDLQEPSQRFKYRYHYQDSQANLIFRYDNAPHYSGISSFPDHKHAEVDPDVIVESCAPSLREVLHEIEERTVSSPKDANQ